MDMASGDIFNGSTESSVGRQKVVNTVNYNNIQSQAKIEDDASSSAKIWSIYMIQAGIDDQALVERWKENMDGILIFAGLFSAVVTAFIVESYKTLQRIPEDTVAEVLTNISYWLAASSTASLPPPVQIPFKATPSSVRVNVFWILSLGFALSCALSATLVEQWARRYLQAIQRRPTAQKRAKIRMFLHAGIQRFGMASVVAAIPGLLHISLFLFLAGLFEFLRPINSAVAYVALGFLIGFGALYGSASCLPLYFHDCPYQTSLSVTLWNIAQLVAPLTKPGHTPTSFTKTRENAALSRFSGDGDVQSSKHVFEALRRTVESLTDLDDLEPFVDGIIGFLNPSSDSDRGDLRYTRPAMMQLFTEPSLNLGVRILSLLGTSRDSKGRLNEKRVTTCMDAIWSLAKNANDRTCWNNWCNVSLVLLLDDFMRPGRNDDTCRDLVLCTKAAIVHHLLKNFETLLWDLKRRQWGSVQQTLSHLGWGNTVQVAAEGVSAIALFTKQNFGQSSIVLQSILDPDRPTGRLSDNESASVERLLSASRVARFDLLADFTTNLGPTAFLQQQDKTNDTIGLIVNLDHDKHSEVEEFLGEFVHSLEWTDDILDEVALRLGDFQGCWPKDVVTALKHRPPPAQPEAEPAELG